jgi:transposase InsO family protein
VNIPENEEVDNAVREALNKNLDRTEEYPPNWITEQQEEQQKIQWKNHKEQ